MLTAVAMVALVAGCAGPSASSSASGPVASALVPASELSGTWHGLFWQVAASLYYEDEGRSVLQIREDGTFRATFTPNGGANNLAKPSTWSGTVVRAGNRVTFQDSRGRWGQITLIHSFRQHAVRVGQRPHDRSECHDEVRARRQPGMKDWLAYTIAVWSGLPVMMLIGALPVGR